MKKHLILSLVFISLFSCRTVKKEWVKENFTEKATTQEIRLVQDSVFKSEISRIETHISKIETSVSKNETTLESSSENSTTTVSGTIEAEDGKEKSVTAGDLTITTNGANVSFQTTSSKSLSKEFESKYQELTTLLQEEMQFTQLLQSELNSVKKENTFVKSEIERLETLFSKQTTKRNFTFGTWLIIAVIIIALFGLYRFRKKLNFL